MRSTVLLAFQALFAARIATAQESIAEIAYYSTGQCAGDPFSSSFHEPYFQANKVLVSDENVCGYGFTTLPSDFNMTGSMYTVYVDRSTIPDGCYLVHYEDGLPDDDNNEGHCGVYVGVLNHSDACTALVVAEYHGTA
jgi:hypothetical protein